MFEEDNKPTGQNTDVSQPAVQQTPQPEQQSRHLVGPGKPVKKVAPWLIIAVVAILLVGGIWYVVDKNKADESKDVARNLETSQLSKLDAAQVAITDEGFSPETVSVTKGQAVVWTNTDGKNHIVASDPYPSNDTLKELNSRQPIPKNGSYSFVFDRAGTFTYHDNLNPSMTATVIVK